MTELEKIQREIDDDLRGLGLLPEENPDGAAAPVYEEKPMTAEPREIVAEGFYRETIKQTELPARKPRMPWRRKLIIACLICTLGTGSLGFGIGSAIVITDYFWADGINTASGGENLTEAEGYGVSSVSYVFSESPDGQDLRATLSHMIELVEPSVVSVSASFQTDESSIPGLPQEFWQNVPRETVGNASGIIFREDGRSVYIATNDHVVRDAITVNVRFAGGDRSIPARQVGMNRDADLAVISVDKRDLKQAGVTRIVIASFGDSDNMEMGDAVIAIGNAMGEGNIATQGIISATERIIPVEGRTLTVIQTDAAINFGNSGGALFNTGGEVIGINSAKLLSASVEGMGYSISSNIALPILNDLMNTSSHPSIGIYGTNLNAQLAGQKELGDVPFAGVYVESVTPGMGAESAGILPGDIITGFNGEPVMTMDQMKEAISRCAVGETVEVNIIRGGNLIKLSAELKGTVVSGFTN